VLENTPQLTFSSIGDTKCRGTRTFTHSCFRNQYTNCVSADVPQVTFLFCPNASRYQNLMHGTLVRMFSRTSLTDNLPDDASVNVTQVTFLSWSTAKISQNLMPKIAGKSPVRPLAHPSFADQYADNVYANILIASGRDSHW